MKTKLAIGVALVCGWTAGAQTVRVSDLGFAPSDSTKFLQRALDSGAEKIIVGRKPGAWVTGPLFVRSNTEVVFEEGVELLAKPGAFTGLRDALVTVRDATNVVIRGEGTGALWRMRKADYMKPPYKIAQWRHALNLLSACNVRVENLTLRESGGDGVYFGVSTNSGLPNVNVTCRRLLCDGNNRQGMSVISVKGLLIEDCQLVNTQGHAPQAGIDFEPNFAHEFLQNILLRNVTFRNNAGNGIELGIWTFDATTKPYDITFENCRSSDNVKQSLFYGFRRREADQAVRGGRVTLRGCTFGPSRAGVINVSDLPRRDQSFRMEDCTFDVGDACPFLRQGHGTTTHGVITGDPITIVRPRLTDGQGGFVTGTDAQRLFTCATASPVPTLTDLDVTEKSAGGAYAFPSFPVRMKGRLLLAVPTSREVVLRARHQKLGPDVVPALELRTSEGTALPAPAWDRQAGTIRFSAKTPGVYVLDFDVGRGGLVLSGANAPLALALLPENPLDVFKSVGRLYFHHGGRSVTDLLCGGGSPFELTDVRLIGPDGTDKTHWPYLGSWRHVLFSTSAERGFWTVDFSAPKGELPIQRAFWEDFCLELFGDEPWFFVSPDACWTMKPSARPHAPLPFRLEAKPSAGTWYVDAKSKAATDAAGVGTEARPFKTIQAAVDAAKEGDLILVRPGVYDRGGFRDPCSRHTNRVYLAKKNLVIRSTDGAAVTHIVGRKDRRSGDPLGCGKAAVRCVFANGANGSRLEGFTIRDGASGYSTVYSDDPEFQSGGVSVRSGKDFYLVDCVISNCAAYKGTGLRNGTGVRCLFVDNRAVSTGAAAGGADLFCCVAMGHSQKSYGSSVFSTCRAVNCTVMNNGLPPLAGPKSESYNCLFYRNGNDRMLGICRDTFSTEWLGAGAIRPASAGRESFRPVATTLRGAGDAAHVRLLGLPPDLAGRDFAGQPFPSQGAVEPGARQGLSLATVEETLAESILPPNGAYGTEVTVFNELAARDAAADAAWLALPDRAVYDRHRADLRAKFLRAIGPFPEKTPLKARTTGTFAAPDYRVEKVIFESMPGLLVTGNLYIPTRGGRSGKFPAIVISSGHSGAGKDAPAYLRASIRCAKAGFVTFMFDPYEQGERCTPGTKIYNCQSHVQIGLKAALLGWSMPMLRLWDAIRAVDYVTARPEVDAERIGFMGVSGGGTMTALMNAVDPRLKATAPSCYLTTFTALCDHEGPQDGEQNVFGQLAFGLNHAGYVLLPDSHVLLTSKFSDYFSNYGTHQLLSVVQSVAQKLGTADHYAICDAQGPHGWTDSTVEGSIRWMRAWLRDERELLPLDLESLRALDVGTPVPPDRTDFGVNLSDLHATPNGVTARLDGSRSIYDILRDRLASVGKTRPLPTDPAERAAEVRQLAGIRLPNETEARVLSINRVACAGGVVVERLALLHKTGLVLPAARIGHAAKPSGRVVVSVGRYGLRSAFAAARKAFDAGSDVLVADVTGAGSVMATRHVFYDRKNRPEECSAIMLYLMGESLVGRRATDILLFADHLAKNGARHLSLLASHDLQIAAVHAAAAAPGRFESVDRRGRALSWQETLDRTHDGTLTLDYADLVNGALLRYDWPDLCRP